MFPCRAAVAGIERLQISGVMEREGNPWDKTFYHRLIQTKIGQGLRAQYDQDLAQPLPHRLFTLLMQLNERQHTKRGERREQIRSMFLDRVFITPAVRERA